MTIITPDLIPPKIRKTARLPQLSKRNRIVKRTIAEMQARKK